MREAEPRAVILGEYILDTGATVRATAKVCRVKATSPTGTEIQAHTAKSAVNNAQRAIFFTFKAFTS